MRLAERGAPRWIDHWHAWRQQGREAWAAWTHPRECAALRAWCQQPPWRELGAQAPEVWRKVFAPYPLQGLTVPQRSAWWLTQAHLTQRLLPPGVLQEVLGTPQGWRLCELPLPGGQGLLSVQLVHARLFQHEGDLSLVLRDPWGTPQYTLTFSLFEHEGRPAALIGALQGQLDRPQAAHLTRLCLGLRPPALLLFVMQALAEAWGLSALLAVGAERHVYSGRGMARFIQFDYDGLWAASGATQQDDRLWRLPLPFTERDMTDVPVRKRAQYKRRYAWLAQVRAELRDRVAPATAC